MQLDQSCSLKFLILTVDVGRKRADETASALYVTRTSDAPRLERSLCFGLTRSLLVCPHRQMLYVKLVAARLAGLAVLFTLEFPISSPERMGAGNRQQTPLRLRMPRTMVRRGLSASGRGWFHRTCAINLPDLPASGTARVA